jgi:hypothetical protein
MRQPPSIVFVCQTAGDMHALMIEADHVLTGRIATPGHAVEEWPYPGRLRARFAIAADLLAGDPRAYRLPNRPTDETCEPLELRETHLPGAGM